LPGIAKANKLILPPAALSQTALDICLISKVAEPEEQIIDVNQ
jgi:hypothetical protein